MRVSHKVAALLLAGTSAAEKGRRPRKAPRARRAPEPIDDIEGLPAGPRVVLPFPPVECSPNYRDRKTKIAATRSYRKICGWETIAQKLKAPAEGPIHLHVAFFPPDRADRDDDNIIGAFKPGRDGIADGLKVNDFRFRVTPEFRTETRCCVVVIIIDRSAA